MLSKVINFTVNGKATSNEEMLLDIPYEYADLFEEHNFPTYEHLRVAIMHARCASEANYYGNTFEAQVCERDLKHVLKVQ